MVVWQRDGVAEWVKGLSLSYCSIKHEAISSITVDIADKTLSCVDLKPLVWQLYYSQWTEGGKKSTRWGDEGHRGLLRVKRTWARGLTNWS